MYWPLRRQASSHRVLSRSQNLLAITVYCGSGPARDSGGSVIRAVGCSGFFAGKPAPTGFGVVHKICWRSRSTVGVGLLAIAVGQSSGLVDVPASSQASQLPQGFVSFTRSISDHGHCGSGLARDSGGSVTRDVGCSGLFAGKPAPSVGLLTMLWLRISQDVVNIDHSANIQHKNHVSCAPRLTFNPRGQFV